MENSKINNSSVMAVGGVPAVVVGVLLALKHIGMTSISYWSIVLFGLEVWLVCLLIGLAIWAIIFLIALLFVR